MNRRTQGLILSETVNGFTKYKVVEGLSPRTLESYTDNLLRLQDYLDNPPLANVTADHINDFLFWLRSDYEPQRLTGNGAALCAYCQD
jgi:site-specific recombinase XerD